MRFLKNIYLSKFDIFGRNIQILFKNQRHHKTNFGGFVTLSLFFVFLYFIYYQAKDKNIPRLFFRNIVHTSSEQIIDLSSNEYDLAIGLRDSNGVLLADPSIFTLSAYLMISNQYQYSIVKELTLEICQQDSFRTEDTKQNFMNLGIQNLYCLKNGQEIKIEGNNSSPSKTNLKFSVTKCKMNEIIQCKSETDINNFLSDISLSIYFTDYVVKSTRDQQPFSRIFQNIQVPSGLPLSQIVNVLLQKTFLQDIGGIYNEIIDQNNYITFDKYIQQVVPYRADGDLFTINFQNTEGTNAEIIRGFQPWSIFISQLGGFYQFLIGIGCLICYPLSQIDLDLQLVNALFNIDPEPEKSPNSSPRQKKDSLKSLQKQSISNLNPQENFVETKENKTKGEIEISNIQLDNDPPPIKPLRKISNFEKSQNTPQIFTQFPQQKLQQTPQIFQNSVSQIPNYPLSPTVQTPQTEDLISKKMNSTQNRKTSFTGAIAASPLFKSIISKRSQSATVGTNNGNQLNGTGEQIINKISKIKDNLKQITLFRKFFNVNSIEFTLWKYLKLNLLCCKRQKQTQKRQLVKSVSSLYKHLDVYNILQKLIEIDKIKMLFLNDNQRKLFEYLPQPKIFSSSEKREEKVDILFTRNKSVIEQAEDAWEALKQMRSSSHQQTIIDKKLLEMIDPTFIDLFEETVFDAQENGNTKITINSHSVPEKKQEFLSLPNKDNDSVSYLSSQTILIPHDKGTLKKSEFALGENEDTFQEFFEKSKDLENGCKKGRTSIVSNSEFPQLESQSSLPNEHSYSSEKEISDHINISKINFGLHINKLLQKIKKDSSSSSKQESPLADDSMRQLENIQQ